MALHFTVSDPVEREIRKCRREVAKYRHQRNEARAELSQAMNRIRELHAENVQLRAELRDVRRK